MKLNENKEFIKKLYELYYEHLDSLDASMAKENVFQSDKDGEFSLFLHILFPFCSLCYMPPEEILAISR